MHQPSSFLRRASCMSRATGYFAACNGSVGGNGPVRQAGSAQARPQVRAWDVAPFQWITTLAEKFQVLMAVRRTLSNKKTARRRSSCSADEAEIRPRERPRPPILFTQPLGSIYAVSVGTWSQKTCPTREAKQALPKRHN